MPKIATWDFITIALGTTLLSCALGIAVDLVTANIAVEYFTVHHPKVVDSQSPWVMAFVWGIGASWWAGAIAGALLGWFHMRLRFRLEPRRVLRMVAIACGAIWLTMMVILVAVYGVGGLVPATSRRPSFEQDRRLMAVAVAHLGEYAIAAIAMIWVAIRMRIVIGKSDSRSEVGGEIGPTQK